MLPGSLFRCRECGLGQRQPCLRESELPKLYERAEAAAMDYLPEENGAWSEAKRFLLQRWSPAESKAVLDIGCHTGLFLASLPQTWQRFGIEGALLPRAHATAEHSVEMIADRIEDVPSSWQGRFDAVTMFDVAEHLLNPARGLANALKLLRPGGHLLVGTADLDAWTWRVARGRHWYLQTPLHLSVLSRDFLARVASDNGVVLVELKPIPHQRASISVRCNDFVETVYAGLRDRGGVYRIPQRLLHSLPGLARLRHMQAIRWSMTLRDHMFAALRSDA